jgi:hypothetical protein
MLSMASLAPASGLAPGAGAFLGSRTIDRTESSNDAHRDGILRNGRKSRINNCFVWLARPLYLIAVACLSVDRARESMPATRPCF